MSSKHTLGKTTRKSIFLYYVAGIWHSLLTPRFVSKWQMKRCLKGWENRPDAAYIRQRVDYYNRLKEPYIADKEWREISKIKLKDSHSRYWFDLMRFLRAFPSHMKAEFINGDTWENPDEVTICKARRIDDKSSLCILFNMDSLRHFTHVKDFIPFEEKQDKLLFRGEIHGKPHRIRFFENWAGHPGFDLGDTATNWDSPWPAKRMSIPEHFQYKYILVLEGNDVATALQWIGESNCVPVMARPTVENWLMHGAMQPGVHYIEIKSDFSDAAEKIDYYNAHPEEAKKISEASKEWMSQFNDKRREQIISYLVLQKFLDLQR